MTKPGSPAGAAAELVATARAFGFDPVPPERWAEHVPPAVATALAGTDAVVFPVPDDASDTPAFCARFGWPADDCANTIVVRYSLTKNGDDRHAAVLTLGARRLDVNGALKRALAAKRLSFARLETAVALSGMEFGGITAVGLPAGLPLLVDQAVTARPHVVIGAGWRRTKILLAPAALAALPGARVAPVSLPRDD
jgi:prolyl-tRNA editing enzyme YbaK/EbsC (Cys-tRNA(Pro) deacylase)